MGPCRPEEKGNTKPVPLGSVEDVNQRGDGVGGGDDDDDDDVVVRHRQQQQQHMIDVEIETIDRQQPDQRDNHWATSEGYTPLADYWNSQQQQQQQHGDDNHGTDGVSTWMVSFGPSSSSDDGESSDNDEDGSSRPVGGAFLINPSVFQMSLGENDDDDDNDNKDDDEKNHFDCTDIEPSATGSTTNNGNDPYYSTILGTNFEDVAANALRALDSEYQQIVIREIQAGQDDSTGTMGGANTSSCATNNDIDEDIKIIAAAFDRRNEEMRRRLHGKGINLADGVPTSRILPDGTTLVRPSSSTNQKDGRPLDLDAVKRAVDELSVKNKDTHFHQKFAAWQEKQQQQQTNTTDGVVSARHELIPQTSLKAFAKSTIKAKEATANLTRSATLAEAIVRILLSKSSNRSNRVVKNPSLLVIDIVGVDHVECGSISRIQATFRPIVGWLRSRTDLPYQQVRFRLIGRELSFRRNNVAEGVPVDLLPIHPITACTSLREATATCYSGMYHTFLDETAAGETENIIDTPDLLVAFNAGIWGYQDWEHTIRYLAQRKSSGGLSAITLPPIPMVITAYTLEECQEDYEVIAAYVAGTTSSKYDEKESYRAKVLWEPEMNPFGSRSIRETKSSNQVYRENAYWQAWWLGGDPCDE